jgi:geranylgeranyl diphosphate synthase type I
MDNHWAVLASPSYAGSVTTGAPAQAFADLAARESEGRVAQRLRELAQYGFPALLGFDGITKSHAGSSHVVTRLIGVSYAAHGGGQAPGALPERQMALIAGAQEMFLDATVAHDDLMTRAETRRGQPALHRHFATLHRQSDWMGDPDRLGAALAQAIGDALLVISESLFAEAIRDAPPGQVSRLVRLRQTAQLERVLGQAMDSVYPALPDIDEPEEIIQQAVATIRAKTAQYVGAMPLALGAAGAGAANTECDAMAELGLHLAGAYQLHNELLGAVGTSEQTGKPTGQDLIDGKRTVLVGTTMRLLGPSQRRSFTNALLRGAAPPVEARVEHLQGVIRQSGALEAIEAMIADRQRTALEILEATAIGPAARESLADACQWLLSGARL